MLSRPARARIARKEATSSIHNVMPKLPLKTPLKSEPVKRTGGCRDTHGTHTGHAGAQGHTDHTDEPHNHPNSPTHTRTSARRPKPRPTQQPQARSRPLPAADSEEAAPSVEPYRASTRSHSAPPRACSKAVGEMTFEMKAHIPVTPPRSTRREMLHRTHFHNTPNANGQHLAARAHVHCLIHKQARSGHTSASSPPSSLFPTHGTRLAIGVQYSVALV